MTNFQRFVLDGGIPIMLLFFVIFATAACFVSTDMGKGQSKSSFSVPPHPTYVARLTLMQTIVRTWNDENSSL